MNRPGGCKPATLPRQTFADSPIVYRQNFSVKFEFWASHRWKDGDSYTSSPP